MKNNKKTIILLAVLMVIVWGAIIRELISGVEEEPSYSGKVIREPIKMEKNIDLDTFRLSLDYEDPFMSTADSYSLRRNSSTTVGELASKNLKGGASRRVGNTIQWPIIEFGGTIKSSNKTTVGLLKLNNKQILVKERDTRQEVTVIKMTDDSITLKYQTEKKTYYKKDEI